MGDGAAGRGGVWRVESAGHGTAGDGAAPEENGEELRLLGAFSKRIRLPNRTVSPILIVRFTSALPTAPGHPTLQSRVAEARHP